MSLVVEDGTGLSNAESYVSVAAASTYLANLGLTNWATLTTLEMEQALRRATNYMEQAYRERWIGYRSHMGQALAWPRWNVIVDNFPVDPTSVPADIANVCAELAFKAAAGDLAADLDPTVTTKKVGPIETQYDRYSIQYRRYRSIDMRLAPYLTRTGQTGMVVRA